MNQPSRTLLNKLPLMIAAVLISLIMQGCGKKTEDAQTLIADARTLPGKGRQQCRHYPA